MIRGIRRLARRAANSLLNPFGLEVVRKDRDVVLGYLPAKETTEAARAQGLSVCDYVERMWNREGETQRVIDRLTDMGVLSDRVRRICEIGTGTGRYLEKVMKICNPSMYESYEPARDWAEWLDRTYDIVTRKSDGTSLAETASSSVDLVHAHAVFVYLPFLTTYGYFQEIVRVLSGNHSGVYAVFDIISEECLDQETVSAWLQSQYRYPSFLSKTYVLDFFAAHGFSFLGEFFSRLDAGRTHYLVFKKHPTGDR